MRQLRLWRALGPVAPRSTERPEKTVRPPATWSWRPDWGQGQAFSPRFRVVGGTLLPVCSPSKKWGPKARGMCEKMQGTPCAYEILELGGNSFTRTQGFEKVDKHAEGRWGDGLPRDGIGIEEGGGRRWAESVYNPSFGCQSRVACGRRRGHSRCS